MDDDFICLMYWHSQEYINPEDEVKIVVSDKKIDTPITPPRVEVFPELEPGY